MRRLRGKPSVVSGEGAPPRHAPSHEASYGLQRTIGNRAARSVLAEAARVGTSGVSVSLPFLDQIQASFGRHRISDVRAHLDASAAEGTTALRAKAFTAGDHVAFARGPTLFTAAHEAAHVIQQRGGACADARHEAHANAVAARVVLGQSSEALLDAYAPSAAPSVGVVQCEHESDVESFSKSADLTDVFPNVHKLRNGAAKLVSIGNKLKKQGKGYFYDDKEKLASAYNILDVAKALTDLATGIDGVIGSSQRLPNIDNLPESTTRLGGLKGANKATTDIRNAVAALKLVADLMDNEAAAAFEADPTSFKKSAAWAEQTAGVFTAASKAIDIIPDGLLPGVVKETWKGLLRAPASYVKAFLSIMGEYVGRIDAVSGGSESKEQAQPSRAAHHASNSGGRARVTGADAGDWEGELSLVYQRVPRRLREFMQTHRKRGVIDLFKTPTEDIGRGQLVALIETYADPADKESWIALVEPRPDERRKESY